MILVDTSVWIDYFKGVETQESNLLDIALINDEVAIGDLILLEILQGFRSDKDYETAKTHLLTLHQFSMLSPDIALKAAENYRILRKKGMIIADICCFKKNKLFGPHWKYFWSFFGRKIAIRNCHENIFRN